MTGLNNVEEHKPRIAVTNAMIAVRIPVTSPSLQVLYDLILSE